MTWGWGLDGDDFNDGEGNTSDLEPIAESDTLPVTFKKLKGLEIRMRDTLDHVQYSQQPEQLRREPMDHYRGNQYDPHHSEVADGLYRHQPLDPVEQIAQHNTASYTTTTTGGAGAGGPQPLLFAQMRTFSSGATRDTDQNKPDYKGFLSPLAIQHFGRYMLKHQKQADGTMRSSDNWKKGIPVDEYFKSFIRHAIDAWAAHELGNWAETEELLDAILFNVNGILHEREKERQPQMNDGKITASVLAQKEGWLR